MQGGGHADVLIVLQVPANAAGAVPCERLPKFFAPLSYNEYNCQDIMEWGQKYFRTLLMSCWKDDKFLTKRIEKGCK